jgi:hypothetical protein
MSKSLGLGSDWKSDGRHGSLVPTLKADLARLHSRFTGEKIFTSPEGEIMDLWPSPPT